MRNSGNGRTGRRTNGSYSSEMRRQGIRAAYRGQPGTAGMIDKYKEDTYNRFMQMVDEYMNNPKPRSRR